MSLASLAGHLAKVAVIGPAIARLKRRAVRATIGGVLVGVFGLAGLAYLLIALRHELERHLGAVYAPFAIGGALCLCALAAYLVFLRPRGNGRAALREKEERVRERIERPVRDFEGDVAGNPLKSVSIALAVG